MVSISEKQKKQREGRNFHVMKLNDIIDMNRELNALQITVFRASGMPNSCKEPISEWIEKQQIANLFLMAGMP